MLDAPTFRLVLQQAQQGDRASFARVVEAYYPRALRFALQMLHHREDAEEAVQDAFLRVYDHLPRFRDDAPFDPWFFRILGNRCRTLLGKRKRRLDTIDYGDIPGDVADESATTDGELLDASFVRDVHRAIATLPPEQREAFLLRHVNDMEYEEMTIVTGAKGSTLRMRVKRAIDTLRVTLREGAIRE